MYLWNCKSEYTEIFGAPDRGCSPTHDGDFIYRKHCSTAHLHDEHAVRAGRRGRKLAVGSRLYEANSVTSSRPPLTSIQTCVFCADGAINPTSSTRNRALRFCQVFLCYLTSIPFKYSLSVTLILNYN
ncbi:hypothetical protein Zmor_021853 [Zophobas morio]|uniref:Uncharacterized protein n=1 Tax=Zophobas morio TaxID=2755281 RepID=A0AA38I712_9CUCU|nr:hypothetical protein Zmor_021853 [Zophobas morio]